MEEEEKIPVAVSGLPAHTPKEVQAHLESEPPEVVHHYTDQHGLLGILSKGEVWATSVYDLNDSSEFKHAIEVALQLIQSRLEEEPIPKVKKHLGYLRSAAQYAGINICVASWSASPDDLSQWRAYSRGTTGYSVDVGGASLRLLAQQQKFLFAPCIYDEGEQRLLMDAMIDANLARNVANDAILGSAKEADYVEQYMLKKHGGDFGFQLNCYGALFKHPSFATEKEWRLISAPMDSSRVDFRSAGLSNIASYYRFALLDDEAKKKAAEETKQPRLSCVRSIHVGPCPEPESANQRITFLLSKYCARHPRPDVYSSKVPFRSW